MASQVWHALAHISVCTRLSNIGIQESQQLPISQPRGAQEVLRRPRQNGSELDCQSYSVPSRKAQVLRCPLICNVTWVRSMPTTVAPLTQSPTYTVWPFTMAAGRAPV